MYRRGLLACHQKTSDAQSATYQEKHRRQEIIGMCLVSSTNHNISLIVSIRFGTVKRIKNAGFWATLTLTVVEMYGCCICICGEPLGTYANTYSYAYN